MPNIRLGDVIPNFNAVTTQGKINFHEWQENKWVVLFSHPADFTPVCTTELGRFAAHKQDFERRNVKLLAHSCDDLKNHVKWEKDVKFFSDGLTDDLPFPIIADDGRKLAVELDMIDPYNMDDKCLSLTVRALYIIDPQHRLRLSMHYPISTGRNINEVIRVIDALQLVEKYKEVVTPANWKPGEKVMIEPQVKDEEVEKLFPSGIDHLDMPSGINYIRTTHIS